jgi:hypothetical protein
MANYQRNMAHDRNSFKNALEGFLGGALGEFYKARLATNNGESRWVLHWTQEAYDLVDQAVAVFVDHPIGGFKDRSRALQEVMEHLESRDRSYRTRATNAILRDFKRKRLKVKLNDRDTEAFWLMVEQNVKVPRHRK